MSPFISFLGPPLLSSPEPTKITKLFWSLLWSVVLCKSTKLTINCVSSGILSQHHLSVCGDFYPKHPPRAHTDRQSEGKELPSLLT